jgi:hypothetical protein
MAYNKESGNENIKFISSKVGGDNDDTTKEFKEQLKLIEKEKKNFSKNYNNTEPRLGNDNLSIDDFYFSNPIVYPEDPDLYFQYIQQKNLKSINTQVITSVLTFNIDSSLRLKNDSIIIDFYELLSPESFTFTNNSNLFSITVSDISRYNINDLIIVQGFTNYSVLYNSLNLFFENETNLVKLDIKANFDNFIPLLDVYINISGITNINNVFKNIPISLLNRQHKIELLEDNYIGFRLPINFYTDNTTDSIFTSSCKIEYLSIGNYPINLINANLPYSKYNLQSYQSIFDIVDNKIIIKMQTDISINDNIDLNNSSWINNKFLTGGSSIQIGRIKNIITGSPKSSKYKYILPKMIQNIVSVKMVSSEIPNTYFNINNNNNYLYWDIADDNNEEPYNIALEAGFYNFTDLKTAIETKASQVPRIFSNNLYSEYYYKFNIIKVDFDETLGTTTFNSFSKFLLPRCLIFLQEINSTTSSYLITIEQPVHNLGVGQRIYIENSLDFLSIPASYINNPEGFIIVNIINNNKYQIRIDYVNPLNVNYTDITGGGYIITISVKNSFCLFFDESNTFGDLIGFRNVGNSLAVTPYSSIDNDFKITNTQLYVYGGLENDTSANLILKTNILYSYNYKYILLKCKGFDRCSSSNNIKYFYKIEFDNFNNNNNNKDIFYNSYIDNPIYFYPSLSEKIEILEFEFIDPYGNEFNFYNLENSFTLVFTCINNYPENTNLNPKVARS